MAQEFVSNSSPPQTLKMTTFDPDGTGPQPRVLVVVGSFNRVGSVAANNIASYDGQVWRSLGTGFNTNPLALFAWAPNNDGNQVIVVGGPFTTAGGVQARGAAVWNGQAWSPIGPGFGTNSVTQAYPVDFCVFDGALHAIGNFRIENGGPANGIARWNGKSWEAVGAGIDRGGLCMATLPAHEGRREVMCIGGYFASAGGLANAFFARYADVGCCPADYDEDGVVNSQDFFKFVGDFLNGSASADFNEDGTLNSADFFDFLRSFFEGC
jgi:hypothetical protein